MTKVTVNLFSAVLFGLMSSGAHAEAPNRCARYGTDYAPVAGSNGCVRLGGHIRVDQARVQPSAPMVPLMSYAAGDGVQPASARIAQQPIAPFELFRR